MEEFDFKEIIEYYIKKLPIIVLFTVLAILVGYLYIAYYQVPMYQGKTTIILLQNNDQVTDIENKLTETADQLDVNEKLVATYSEIIKSRRVLEQVINNLELKDSLKELENKISVDSIENTSIIEITIKDEQAKKAASIANELAKVFGKEIAKLYKLENVSVVDEAIPEAKPYNINILKQMIIYICIGVVLSCIIIFILYYFDNTIKNKKEIKNKLNVPILGEVPLAINLIKKDEKNSQMNGKTTKKGKIKKIEFQSVLKNKTSSILKSQKVKLTENQKNMPKATEKTKPTSKAKSTSNKSTTKKTTNNNNKKKEGKK